MAAGCDDVNARGDGAYHGVGGDSVKEQSAVGGADAYRLAVGALHNYAAAVAVDVQAGVDQVCAVGEGG